MLNAHAVVVAAAAIIAVVVGAEIIASASHRQQHTTPHQFILFVYRLILGLINHHSHGPQSYHIDN